MKINGYMCTCVCVGLVCKKKYFLVRSKFYNSRTASTAAVQHERTKKKYRIERKEFLVCVDVCICAIEGKNK